MHQPDSSNTIFNLAASFVNNTHRHIFLTGKAGTGKTTFLKHIGQHSSKKMVVVAPTGVAAINAGGVTIHSFFQLPFGPFIPDDQEHFSLIQQNSEINNAQNLVKKIRLNADKKELMRNMDLLVIDEVSMVRADMIDAIDAILRFVRKNSFQPFGGVQVLFIGDLFQLPPVVQDDQWELLSPHYTSPFFFHAKAIAQSPPLYIELKKIYRQKDLQFIEVLNSVRNDTVTEADLLLLNQRFKPDFISSAEDPYIVLSTHNRKTEIINTSELEKLPGPLHRFAGNVTGEFSEKSMPTENILYLKEGAQILFIKNDTEKKYYNGKIARVSRIEGTNIYIKCEEDGEELLLAQEKWKNIRYSFNEEKNRIEEEEIGTFTQYPIRLAWAITIHKSQGLTFTKAIIDAGASFAAGQVYVALSRCTSLEGMVLRSRIERHCIKTDEKVIAFAQKEAELDELHKILEKEQAHYERSRMVQQYNLLPLVRRLQAFIELMLTRQHKERSLSMTIAGQLLEASLELEETCRKFRLQLMELIKTSAETGDETRLMERKAKADHYFSSCIEQKILSPLKNHISLLKSKPNTRKHLKSLEDLEKSIREYSFFQPKEAGNLHT